MKRILLVFLTTLLAIAQVNANKEIYIRITNNRSAMITVHVEAYKNIQASGSSLYFCWGPVCYPPSVTTSPTPVEILAGATEMSFHSTYIVGDSTQTSNISYTFYIENDYSDSVNITFDHNNSMVGTVIYDLEFTPSTGINSSERNYRISKVYPNPAVNQFTIDYAINGVNNAELDLSNVLGQSVLNTKLPIGTGKAVVNTNDLESGIYFYSLFLDGEAVETKRLIVNH